MIALSDTIAAPGIKPWCAGIGSGEATGWPVTDWLEDVLLRAAGPDVYDQWVNHEIPFNDPQVVDGARRGRRHPQERRLRQRRHRRRQEHRHHRRSRTVACRSSTASAPCTARRASTPPTGPRAPRSARTATSSRSTCPPIDEEFGKPVLGGGEFVAAFDDRPEVQAFQTYLSSRHLGQREGQGHAGRRLGQRQQGPRRRQPGQPDRQAVRRDPAGPGRGLPLRRLRPDARRRGRRLVLEGDDGLDHRPEHQGRPRQHRGLLAV